MAFRTRRRALSVHTRLCYSTRYALFEQSIQLLALTVFGGKKEKNPNQMELREGRVSGLPPSDYTSRHAPRPPRNKERHDWRRAVLATRQSRCAVLGGAGSERAPVGGAGALVPVLIPPFFPSLLPSLLRCSSRRSPQAAPPRGTWRRGAELLVRPETAAATVRPCRGGEQAAPGRAVRGRRVRPGSPRFPNTSRSSCCPGAARLSLCPRRGLGAVSRGLVPAGLRPRRRGSAGSGVVEVPLQGRPGKSTERRDTGLRL